MDYIPHTGVGLKSHNFACIQVYVISDMGNPVRQRAFEEAWSIFNDFQFEYVQAVMASDLDYDKLIEDGTLVDFIDPTANISKTIVAVALSHKKVYQKIKDSSKPGHVLIMEDDARPSQALFDDIQNGTFDRLIKQLKRSTYDCFFWGRGPSTEENIPSIYYEKEFRIPQKFTFLGAQAYALDAYTAKYLLKELKQIRLAADTFLDYHALTLRKTFCSSKTLITQYGFITHKFFGDSSLPEDDLRNVFKSSTQVLPKTRHNNKRIHGKDYEYVNPDILQYVDDIEPYELEYTIGRPFETETTAEGFWKRIIFKSLDKLSGTSTI